MSKYIGKRVFYHCGKCLKPFTLNKQSVDDSEASGQVYCSTGCFEAATHKRASRPACGEYLERGSDA